MLKRMDKYLKNNLIYNIWTKLCLNCLLSRMRIENWTETAQTI